MPVFIPRSSWPTAFPEVVVHSDLTARKAHPSYAAAKSGDPQAAKVLVEDLLAAEAVDQLTTLVGDRHPLLLAVTADKVSGFNAIPDAMAQGLAASLGLEAAAGSVVQANKVGHTKADGWHRLVTPALFTGEVVAGADDLLVDDQSVLVEHSPICVCDSKSYKGAIHWGIAPFCHSRWALAHQIATFTGHSSQHSGISRFTAVAQCSSALHPTILLSHSTA